MYNDKFKNSQLAPFSLSNRFLDFFSNVGYELVEPAKITSGIDPTVRFIGSHISVLKPFLHSNIPSPGVYIKQNCIRTWNANKLKQDDFKPAWGSYFTSLGVLAQPNLEKVFFDMKDFFVNALCFSEEDIILRVKSSDKDLFSLCMDGMPNSIEADSRPDNYYRHSIGENGTLGRNFNIAILNRDKKYFYDIGNFIIFEKDSKPIGVELAFGTSTIIKEVRNLEHVLDTYYLNNSIDDVFLRAKFLDSLITSSILISEGLKPSSSNTRGRILKKYLEGLKYNINKCGIEKDEVEKIIDKLAIQEGFGYDVSSQVVSYL